MDTNDVLFYQWLALPVTLIVLSVIGIIATRRKGDKHCSGCKHLHEYTGHSCVITSCRDYPPENTEGWR